MNPFKNTSANEVRGKLLLNGLSVSAFAKGRGYNPSTVLGVMYRYCGSQDEPRAIKTAAILDDLYAATTKEAENVC